MLSASSVVRSRALVQSHALRRLPARRIGGRRFQSTQMNPNANSTTSHMLAGVAGGATVFLAGYTYYHFSGTKATVQMAVQAKDQFKTYRDQVIESARSTTQKIQKDPSAVLQSFRSLVKSYAGFVPGLSGNVDKVFDELDQLHEEHGEKMDEILGKARDELVNTVQKGNTDWSTAQKVYEVLQNTLTELQGLGIAVGSQLLDKYPGVKEKLGGSYDQLTQLAESKGEDGKKIMKETRKKIQEMFSKGIDAKSIDQARQLLTEGTEKLQELAGEGQAKMENKWEILQGFLKAAPGGQEALDKVPHMQTFLQVAGEKSEEAKQLAKETVQDIVKLLEEKGKKAEKLKEGAKEDVEKKEGKGEGDDKSKKDSGEDKDDKKSKDDEKKKPKDDEKKNSK